MAEFGLTRYLKELQRLPMMEPQGVYILAKRWREHGDRAAAHRLVTSHLLLVVKIALGYRGYGLPISEVISEGNVGLMQAVNRFEPEKGFQLATYATWWIRASIHEYILRSWSLVRTATTANRKKLFFNLRKAKSKICALHDGDMRPDQVKLIAKQMGVTEQDVIDMNRWLGGDASLNAPIREDSDTGGEWQDRLVDESASQETVLVESDELDNRRKALASALAVLNNRERRIFEARRLAENPITLEELADEFGVSRERVRQIDVSSFEKVQKAVKNRVAVMEPQRPCGTLASNSLPWWKNPRMDVSRWVRFTATERRERAAARRVLIDSDLRSEPSLDDPRTEPCVITGRLNGALQMESYPKFHNEAGVPIVRIGCREFKCIGDKPPQDHPHIYLNMGEASEIICPYCSTLFRLDPRLGANRAVPANCAYSDID